MTSNDTKHTKPFIQIHQLMSTWGSVKPRLGESPKGSSPTRHCHLPRNLHRHTPYAVRCCPRIVRDCEFSHGGAIAIDCLGVGEPTCLCFASWVEEVRIFLRTRGAQGISGIFRLCKVPEMPNPITADVHPEVGRRLGRWDMLPWDATGCVCRPRSAQWTLVDQQLNQTLLLGQIGVVWKSSAEKAWCCCVQLLIFAVSDHSHHSHLWARPLPQGVKP